MNTFADGERRWTAVLFADMANFSAVTEAVGPEQVYQLVSRIFDIAIGCVEDHGGKPLNFGGDSLLASFGAPVALEDASVQACRAALMFLDKLRAEQDAMQHRFGVRPEFRVGISGGDVVIGRLGLSDKMDLNIMGAPVNEASRLEAMAGPNQILISGAVAEQAEGWVKTNDLGLKSLKGFGTPRPVFELIGLRRNTARFDAMERRGLVPIVGREVELERLEHLFGTLPDGLALATVKGPPGIGKSRLMHAFQAGFKGGRILLGQCNPASEKTAFKPFAEILRAAAKVDGHASAAQVVAALGAEIGDTALAENVSPLFETSTGPATITDDNDADLAAALALRIGIRDVLYAVFAKEPTLVLIEDAHWLDDLSSSLVDLLAEADTTEKRAALVLTHRPEYNPRWINGPVCVCLTLMPLSPEQTSTLVAQHLQVPKLSENLSHLLYSKAEGIPLFAEEILRFLLSSDALVAQDGSYSLKPGDAPVVTAGNLQQLVLRRVDGMPAQVRQSLNVLSAVGRQISAQILNRLVPEDQIDGFLAHVTEAALLEPDPTGGPQDFRFSHALLRDAVYGSLLEEQRKRVHHLIADRFEGLQNDVNADLTSRLAYHFTRADNPKKAVEYLIKAARKSYRSYAFRSMYDYFQTALDFVHNDPDVITDTQYNQMVVMWLTGLNDQGDFRTLVRVADQTLPRMTERGAQAEHDRALAMMAMALAHTRDYDRGIKLMRPAVDRAIQTGNHSVEGWCKVALMRLLDESGMGTDGEIVALGEDVAALAQKTGDHRLDMARRYLLGAHYRGLGDVTRALDYASQLREFAKTQGDLRARAYANWSEAIILQTSDEVERAYEMAIAGRELAVTDSADRLVHSAIACGSVVLGPEPELLKDEHAATLNEAMLHNDFNLVHPLMVTYAIMDLRMRRLHKGWTAFSECLRDVASVGNVTYFRFFLLSRAEIALIIAGLLVPPPVIEGEPDRNVRNPDKMTWRDILTAMRIKLTARKRVQADLAIIHEHTPVKDGIAYARILICEAVLCRKPEHRKAKLDQALAIAKQHNMRQIIRRIEANMP